jgi:hypothetical protein
LESAYFDFFESQAERLGIADRWEKEVRDAWNDGKGTLAAGAVLARRQMSGGDGNSASETVERILARPDVTGEIVSRLASHAQATGQQMIRTRLAEDGAQRSWPFAEGMIHWVNVLDAQGQREKAREILARYDWLAAYAGGPEMLGRTWLQLGDFDRARSFYQVAWKQDSLALSSSEIAGMAGAQLAGGHSEAVRILLRRAFADPACREYGVLIDYLVAANRRWREELEEFGISGSREHEFAAALFGYFEKAGRVTEAVELVSEIQTLVIPAQDFMREAPAAGAITCGRLRVLARKTGAFVEIAKLLDQLAKAGFSEARAERAALEAERATRMNESAGPHWKAAFVAIPANWEYARSLAASQAAEGALSEARATLVRFLSVSMNPLEKAAGLEYWEKLGK